MAQRINLSHYSDPVQARSMPPATNASQPTEPFELPLQYPPDYKEIMMHLSTLSNFRIKISRLQPLFQEPVLGAITYLLFRVANQRLDPAYLVWAQSILVPVPSTFTKPVSSNMSSRGVSMASRDSGLSQLSGTTIGASDTPTSHNGLNPWQDIPAASVWTTSNLWPTQGHVEQPQPQPQQLRNQHYSHPAIYNDDFASYGNVDFENGTVLHNECGHMNDLSSTTPRSISYTEQMESQEIQHQISTGTFLRTESDDLPSKPASVQPEYYVHDSFPTSLTPAYSNQLSPFDEEGLTPASSQQTPQSTNAGLPRHADSARRPSHSQLPTRASKTSMATIKDEKFQPFNPDVLKETMNKKDRSPCPHCGIAFESQPEFISHVTAEHEQPITYECQHLTPRMERCGFTTTRKATMTRHHTDYHSKANECNMPDICRRETTKLYPKRNWGCGWCPHHSTNIKSWAEHYMNRKLEAHRGRRRVHHNVTMLIKSLLLQEATTFWWEREVQHLENSTGYKYEIAWSSDNAEVRRLVSSLESGWHQDRDLNQDQSLQQCLVKELMDQAVKKQSHPITPSNKRAATSSPQGSKMIESRPRQEIQHQPSRSALKRAPGYENAMQADVEKVIAFHQRPVQQRQDLSFF